ncbi:hypothetical protein OOK29_09515 [Streptomyces phaeochromogenes]|uniref:hypothetical protein n=1 Tax=Streptomyces phaeochromogenes TaxID=1923 RepID=UPI002250FCA7|nr:hypothetical protein [Streptomyces phaeochromogenes]MCX5598374.1 hypothetical protein [Streptomyces phaeochromogenes]
MTRDFKADDLTAVREEGSLANLFAHLIGKPIAEPEPPDEDEKPSYHIPRKGAWPCGTAPSGPTPPPCDDCPPTPHRNHEGETA